MTRIALARAGALDGATVTISVKQAPFSAAGDGRIATDGSITSGQATLASPGAAFVAGDVGKAINVGGAGASGNDLVTTILSVAGGVATLAANASTTVASAIVIFGTDDTAAIQAALDYQPTVNKRVVFPDGIYTCAGALKTAATAGAHSGSLTYRSQLALPAISYSAPGISIELIGGGQGMNHGPGFTGPHLVGPVVVSLLSGLTAADSADSDGWANLPSLLGGPVCTSWASLSFTNVHTVIKGMAFMCPSNPSITACNLQMVTSHHVSQSRFIVAVDGGIWSGPLNTHPTGMGLVTAANNNNTSCTVRDVFIHGFYGGLVGGEHISGDQVEIQLCRIAYVPTPSSHANVFGYMEFATFEWGIAYVDPSSGILPLPTTTIASGLSVAMLDLEEQYSTGNIITKGLVYDPQSYLRGLIHYHRIVAQVGVPLNPLGHPPAIVGGDRLQLFNSWDSNAAGPAKGDLGGSFPAPQVERVTGIAPGADFAAATGAHTRTAWWRLNDAAEATVMDDSVGVLDGTWVGRPSLQAATPLSGSSGAAAARLNGDASYGTVPDAAALDPAGDFTLLCLVKLTANNGLVGVAGKWAANQGYLLYLDGTGLRAALNGADVGLGAMPYGEWVLAAMSLTGSTLRGFSNIDPGRAYATAAAAAAIATSEPFTIGKLGAGYLKGSVAEVVYYNGYGFTTADYEELLKTIDGKVGFFGAVPVARPAGVAVTAAGLHAALVSLGLIDA